MADWRNRMDQIVNKVKAQLFAKGVDNMNQLSEIFLVSLASHSRPSSMVRSPLQTPETVSFFCFFSYSEVADSN